MVEIVLAKLWLQIYHPILWLIFLIIFQQNPDGGGFKQVNSVESGSGDLLGQSLSQRQGADQLNVRPINSGDGSLLSQTIGQNSVGVESGSGDILGQSFSQRQGTDQFATRPIQSGDGSLLSQTIGQRQVCIATIGIQTFGD